MTGYLDLIRNASLDELEAIARKAVNEAIAETHATGRSTFGTNARGELVWIAPDGKETPYVAED